MTNKQRSFVKKYLEIGNGTQAALETYDTDDPNVAKVIASENLTKPNVREAIDEALRLQGLTLDVITGNLGEIANTKPEKVSGDTVLKANVELLRLRGAYPDKKFLNVNVSTSFRAKLKAMSFPDLKRYVEQMRKENDELIQDIQELDRGTT